MKTKSKDKKLKIFKVFSQNFEWLKEHPDIKIEPNVSNTYICPMCVQIFEESDLNQSSKNPLTIEHVPPEALGGKSRILTCKKCNSKSGHQLDNHLSKLLSEIDFHSFLPNSNTKTTFELNGNKINGSVEIDDKGEWKLNLLPKNSNPKEAENFFKDFGGSITKIDPLQPSSFGHEFKSPSFTFKKKDTADIKRVEVAVLRIAYLYLFSFFGNSVLLNTSLAKVRKQIQNPDDDILPRPFWIKYDFDDEWNGINIIREPKELRCFLVIFKLKTKSISRKIAIALPGFSEPGLDVYSNIYNFLGEEGGFQQVTIDHIDDAAFISKKEDTFAYVGYWKGVTE